MEPDTFREYQPYDIYMSPDQNYVMFEKPSGQKMWRHSSLSEYLVARRVGGKFDFANMAGLLKDNGTVKYVR